MPLPLKVQQSVLLKVEELMLKGKTRPYQIVSAVPEIKFPKVAKLYLEAVRTRWLLETKDREEGRIQLIKELSAERAELKEWKETVKNEPVKIAIKKEIKNNIESEARLRGLDAQSLNLIVNKGEGFDENLPDEEYFLKTVKLLPEDSLVKLKDIINQEYEERLSQKALPANA